MDHAYHPHMTREEGRLRVLVVDDEALIRWGVCETLTRAGHEVVEASDARSALRTLGDSRRAIDVVLLDLRLPDSTDFGLMHRIKAMAPGCQVILMTADSNPAILTEAIEAGALYAVAKPFDMGVMSELVHQAAA